jgi:AAA domain
MWLEALRDKPAHTGGLDGIIVDPSIVDTALTDGQMSRRVENKLGQALIPLHNGDTRHDAMCERTLGLVRCGKQGDPGVKPALTVLCKAFCDVAEATGRPGGRQRAHTEFLEFIYQKVNGHWTPSDKVARLLAEPEYDDWTRGPSEPPPDADDHHAGEWGGRDGPTAVTTSEPPADVDLAEGAIQHRMTVLRVDREARRRLDDEDRPPITLPPIKRLDELLAEPDTEQQYRIDQLAPADARIMLNAQWKAGKTTIVGNLARALVDNEPFLGRFGVNMPAQHVVLIDDELSENTVRRWLREQNIANTAAVNVITLRGKLSTFNLLDDQLRAEWAQRLGALGCDYLVLDCLRPVLDALGLDERSDAGRFLVAYDALLSDAGISDSLVVQHMGHAGERARGDSRLQDWPDAIWNIVRETDNPDSPRFFSAYGRDVNVAEGRLSFDKASRRLTYTAGSRRDAETEAALVDVVTLLANTREPMSGRGIEDGLSGTDHKRAAIRKAIKKSAADELVTETTGPKNAKLHTIAYPCAECGMPVASKRERHQVCPPPDATEGVLWL